MQSLCNNLTQSHQPCSLSPRSAATAKSILIALLVAPIAQSLIAPRPLAREVPCTPGREVEEAPPPLTDAQADAKKETLSSYQRGTFWKSFRLPGPQYKPLARP